MTPGMNSLLEAIDLFVTSKIDHHELTRSSNIAQPPHEVVNLSKKKVREAKFELRKRLESILVRR